MEMDFGGVQEEIITVEEFPLEKAREILADEQIAVLGYGVQGPAQSLNLRDNGFNVIMVKQRSSRQTGIEQ
jgi:ketol-acid reductoisomerase